MPPDDVVREASSGTFRRRLWMAAIEVDGEAIIVAQRSAEALNRLVRERDEARAKLARLRASRVRWISDGERWRWLPPPREEVG